MRHRLTFLFAVFLTSCSVPEPLAFESDPRILRGEWTGEATLLGSVAPLVYSPDGSRLFYKLADNNAIYDAEGLREVATLELDDEHDFAQFSLDGATLATASTFREENTVSLYNARTGERLDTFATEGGVLKFSGGLERFATRLDSPSPQFEPEEVGIWDVSSKKRLASLTLPTASSGFYSAVNLSADFSTVVTCESRYDEENVTVKLWRVEDGEEQFSILPPATSYCFSLTFSPGESLLAIGYDAGIQVWDVSTGERLSDLSGAAQPLTFSSDNERLATQQEGYIYVWDVQTGAQLEELLIAEPWYYHERALNPQLSQLAWTDYKDQMYLSDLESGDVVADIALDEPPNLRLDLTATYVDESSYTVSGTLLYDGEPYAVQGDVQGGGKQKYLKPTSLPRTFLELEASDANGEVRWRLEGRAPEYDEDNGAVQTDNVFLRGKLSPVEETRSRLYLLERQP